ncbi:hypothetical protein LCGC14_2972740, partial [marine sediment metagenome]
MLGDEKNLEKGGSEEEFVLGMTDEKYLAQISEWEKEVADGYAILKRIWSQNIDYYCGIQTGVDRLFGNQSKAVENRIYMATETMIPVATSRLPDIVVRSDIDNEEAQIDAFHLQDILGFHMERVGIQELSERWIRDMILKRYAVFKVVWDKEIDDVGLRLVDARRIRFPKFGKSVSKLKFVIEDLELSYEQIESFFGKDVAADMLKSRPKDSENKKRDSTFSVKEVWTNDIVVWATDTKILKKQRNIYYDWEKPKNNFFDKPRKPYIIKSLFHTEESIIGDTDYVQQVIPMQDNINTVKRRIENMARKVSNAMLLIDSDVMSEEEAQAITNEEGVIIYGKDAA